MIVYTVVAYGMDSTPAGYVTRKEELIAFTLKVPDLADRWKMAEEKLLLIMDTPAPPQVKFIFTEIKSE